MLELNKIYCGDCLNVMKDIDSDSVDCIVTDPPYQLSSPNTKKATKGFMGKSWDICPSVEIWQECLRVLKPGAFAFVMCIPRQDCLARMICRLEDAGFNISFSSVLHTFASGFPKAQNLSKAADKRGGVSISWFGKWLKEWRTKNSIPQKEIAKLFPSKMGGLTGCVANWELGLNSPTPLQFTKICEHFNLPFESIEEVEREVIGVSNTCIGPSMMKDSAIFIDGKNWRNANNITIPATSQAKALDGAYSGMQLKPAVEIVIVAMKPLEEKTYLDQALKNGHGCTWLDDCRIPFEIKDLADTVKKRDSFKGANLKGGFRPDGALEGVVNSKGRFPANVICENNALSDGNITKSAGGTGIRSQTDTFKGTEGRNHFHYGDEGSYSRYFSLDSWFAERIKLLPKEAQKTFPWLIVPKENKRNKNKGLEDIFFLKENAPTEIVEEIKHYID